MIENPLPKLAVKNSMKVFTKSGNIVNQIVQHLQTIPNFQSMKNNLELLEYVCQLVEEMVKNGNSNKQIKIDKKAIVLEVFTQLFGLLQPELDTISNHIDYFVINKIVKKKPLLKKIYNCAKTKLKSLQKL